MGCCETYFALIKGYCALMILVLPIQFKNGGWGLSALALTVSAVVQSISGFKLVEASKKVNLYSYSLIGYKVLGSWAKVVIDIMIVLT